MIISKILKNARSKDVNLYSLRFLNTSKSPRTQAEVKLRPDLRFSTKRNIGPFGWFLLIVPASAFGLGTWQVQRKTWKENLIKRLHERTNAMPVELPDDPAKLEQLEYFPVHVRGTFLHDKEIHMGPRSLLSEGDASTQSALISKGQSMSKGYLVITPFKLADRDETILINRGWVPVKNKDPRTRQKGQVEGDVDVIGIVRLHEERPIFLPKNSEKSDIWIYRDLQQMSNVTGASPIYLDATNEFDYPGGPIGGQTRIALRNEHLSYIITWYSLCGITSFMWYRQFLKPV